MANNKWVEVEAKSIDDAIKAGLSELNLDDATQANINILREPEGGVFGVGGTKALVRISVRDSGSRNYNKRSQNKRNNNGSGNKNVQKKQYTPRKPRVEADKDEQLKVSIDFLKGLVKSFGLKGVMSIYAPILQIASIQKGKTIGYSKTYKTKKNMRVATIDFGYSDGYLRSGSNNSKVYINGNPCNVVGRVSMDLITIDVSHINQNNLYLGKPVEILGNNQSCEDLALEMGTNEHEILISLGKNSKKVYI